MGSRRIAIIGAGGLAREVEWLLREINEVRREWSFAGYSVTDPSKQGESESKAVGYELLETVDAAVIAIGTPAVRVKLANELTARFPRLEWPVLVHPSARFDRSSSLVGPGVVLTAGVIGTVNLRIEAHAFVNLACTLGHEAVIGAGCVLNPSVNISGGVRIGSGVLVGTGAQVLQNLSIGDGATVGAGAVVTRDVAAGVTVVGAPAKPRAAS